MMVVAHCGISMPMTVLWYGESCTVPLMGDISGECREVYVQNLFYYVNSKFTLFNIKKS